MTARSIDTAPHPDFRHYSTGNFGEVAPERWSPMSWSLVGDPVERGLRAFTSRIFPSARWATGSHYVFVGYFGCRPYHNLSALCQMARELPGVTSEDVTRAYFENAPAPADDVRPHCTPFERAASLPRVLREFNRIRGRLASVEGKIALCEEQVAAGLESGSQVAIGRAVAEAERVLDEAWDLHYTTTSSMIPAAALQRALGERTLPQWEELEPLVNRPDELVWDRLFDGAIGGALESSGFLGGAFYEVADEFEPWKTIARAFTPHPPKEIDGPSQDEMAEVVWRMHRRAKRGGIEQVSRVVVDTMKSREESKSLAMRSLHVFRRLIPSLAADAGVTGDAWAYLRIGELLSLERRPLLAELAERRRAECEEALAEPMPDDLIAPAPGAADAKPRAVANRAERKPSGVSPGMISGVVARLEDAPFNGNMPNGAVVLVCESADAGIQTLLPSVAGLITARGSMLSHISTLAREYGIPAVVNHPLADSLQAGQNVLLNGSTGEVEVIS